MEAHAWAWLRSRVHGTPLHPADDGIAVTVLSGSATLSGEAPRGRAEHEGEAACFGHGVLVGDGAGRDEPEGETAVIGDGVLLRHGAGRWKISRPSMSVEIVFMAGAPDNEEHGAGRDEPEGETAVIGDGVLLRHGLSFDALVAQVIPRADGGEGIAVTLSRRASLVGEGGGAPASALPRTCASPRPSRAGDDEPASSRPRTPGEGVKRTRTGEDGLLQRRSKRTRTDIGQSVVLQRNGMNFMASEPAVLLRHDGRKEPEGETAPVIGDSVLLRHGIGQLQVIPIADGGPKMAAMDIFLARANRDGTVARPRLALLRALGPTYWLQEFWDWVFKLGGFPRSRLRLAWTWAGVVGSIIVQRDGTCAICSTLVCLEARHRLDFERRYGFKSFPFHLTTETVLELKALCQARGVWTPEKGAVEGAVLKSIQEARGCSVGNVPGWNRCRLQVRSWRYYFNDYLLWPPMEPWMIAKLIYEEGPVLGGFVMGTDFYAPGWEKSIYRGARPEDTKRINHSVVCLTYKFRPNEGPNGEPELEIIVLDNQREGGPVRSIMSSAFYCFCELQVEPLNMRDLRGSRWRHLLGKLHRTRS